MGTSKCLFSQVESPALLTQRLQHVWITQGHPALLIHTKRLLSENTGHVKMWNFSHHFWFCGGCLPFSLPGLPDGSLQLGKMRIRNGRSTQPSKFTAGFSQVFDGLSWFFLFCTSSSTICAIPINSCEWFVCLILHAECWKSTLKLWKNNGERMYNWK